MLRQKIHASHNQSIWSITKNLIVSELEINWIWRQFYKEQIKILLQRMNAKYSIEANSLIQKTWHFDIQPNQWKKRTRPSKWSLSLKYKAAKPYKKTLLHIYMKPQEAISYYWLSWWSYDRNERSSQLPNWQKTYHQCSTNRQPKPFPKKIYIENYCMWQNKGSFAPCYYF